MRTRVRPGRRGVAADSTSDRTTAPGPRSPLKAFLPQLIDIFIPLGVYFLGSLFMGRSFFYYIVRKFVAGSDEEAKVKWERAWGDSNSGIHKY